MRATRRFVSSLALSLAATFATPATMPAFAGGRGGAAPSPKPKTTVEKKIYTNDDLDAMAALYGGPSRANEPSANPASERAAGLSVGTSAPSQVPNDQNPIWYAQQTVTMQGELEKIDSELAQLRDYHASASTALPGAMTGFGLYGPFGGITTYNRIDQLLQQRREIAAQMDAIEDAARANGFPPGMLRDSDQILQVAQSLTVVTPAERRANLAREESAYSAKLGQVQDTLDSIHQQAAEQDITLPPSTPAYGGSMLTNNIQDLNNQANDLQQKLIAIQEQAREDATPPAAPQ